MMRMASVARRAIVPTAGAMRRPWRTLRATRITTTSTRKRKHFACRDAAVFVFIESQQLFGRGFQLGFAELIVTVAVEQTKDGKGGHRRRAMRASTRVRATMLGTPTVRRSVWTATVRRAGVGATIFARATRRRTIGPAMVGNEHCARRKATEFRSPFKTRIIIVPRPIGSFSGRRSFGRASILWAIRGWSRATPCVGVTGPTTTFFHPLHAFPRPGHELFLRDRFVAVFVVVLQHALKAFFSLFGCFVGGEFAILVFIHPIEELFGIAESLTTAAFGTTTFGTTVPRATPTTFAIARRAIGTATFASRSKSFAVSGPASESLHHLLVVLYKFFFADRTITVGIDLLENFFRRRTVRPTAFVRRRTRRAIRSISAFGAVATFRSIAFRSIAVGGCLSQAAGEFIGVKLAVSVRIGIPQQAVEKALLFIGNFIPGNLSVLIAVEPGKQVGRFGPIGSVLRQCQRR
jgi:hypothetical protein